MKIPDGVGKGTENAFKTILNILRNFQTCISHQEENNFEQHFDVHSLFSGK